MDIKTIVAEQRAYFATGITKDIAFRIARLTELRAAIRKQAPAIEAALARDLGKHPLESHLTEIGIVLNEIDHVLRHLRRWARPRRVPTPIQLFAASSKVYREPWGVVLVLSPWNYPFQLAVDPLVGAIAGGNCTVVKPGSYAPATAEAIANLLASVFPPAYVTTVLGGRDANAELLEQRFDYIFFTGSVEVGRLVMRKAADHLTPITLELGGKSPCIIASGADLKLAAKRIAFGKIVNAGQTCVAPDYLLIRPGDKPAFIEHYRDAVRTFLGDDPVHNPEYPLIVNEKHRLRLRHLMEGLQAVVGGTWDGGRIAPTLLDNVSAADAIMQEEIFGPILPMIAYETIDEAIAFINAREKPLALYLFTGDRAIERKVVASTSFGGATVNDTLMHVVSVELGFGGVGQSGMGNYKGRRSFETFTHEKPVLRRANAVDLPLRYHPYTAARERAVRSILK